MALKTFYISGSSNPTHMIEVQALAEKLRGLGMRWWQDWDWTVSVEAERETPGSTDLQENISKDIQSAAHADLFIFLDGPTPTRGGNMEYGVRLFTGYIHHIGCVDDYLFYKSYRVKHHLSVEEFLSYATHQF